MNSSPTLVVVLAIASAILPTAASAQEDAPVSPWDERPIALLAHVMPGGPAGWVGASIDVSAISVLGFSLGIGAGLEGPQFALATHVRAPIAHSSALGVELGVSIGEYSTHWSACAFDYDCEQDTYRWRRALWANASMFYELRAPFGLALRAHLGAGMILNAGDAQPSCDGDGGDGCHTRPVRSELLAPFFGLAVGYAFGL